MILLHLGRAARNHGARLMLQPHSLPALTCCIRTRHLDLSGADGEVGLALGELRVIGSALGLVEAVMQRRGRCQNPA